MALPMVHLSVAHRLVQFHGYDPRPAFYLGSVAPDAIHMRPGTNRENKRAVHFTQDGQTDLGPVRRLIQNHRAALEDTAFAEGYCVHILTDLYWREKVVGPLYASLDSDMPRHELRTLYYDECDKVDLELYDGQSWRTHVWELLAAAKPGDFDGLLTQDEIEKWRDRVLSWYDKNRQKGDYQSRYITQELVLEFIVDAAVQAHEQLWMWKSSIQLY